MVANGLCGSGLTRCCSSLLLPLLQPAIQAFRALRHRNASPLQAIDDDLLGQLLLELRWVVGSGATCRPCSLLAD